METVRRLTREVRIQAKYDRSLAVLKYLERTKVLIEQNRVLCLVLGEKEE